MAPAAAQAAELQGDFHFNDTRTAPTGQPISDIGDGNAFASDTVDGTARAVLEFPSGNGLSLPATGFDFAGSYSVVMLFRLDSAGTGRRKLLDFADGWADAGLYLCEGHVQIDLIGASPCLGEPASLGDWLQVAFTRDADTGEARAYLGGEDTAALDPGGALTPQAALRFFRDDDGLPGGEQSGGAVARIRVYEGVLSPEEVGGLDRVDQTAPAVSLSALPSLTNDPTPALSGGAGSEAGDLGEVTVKLYSGAAATGGPVATVSIDRSGAMWAATAPSLDDGTYTAQAEQLDGAGNTGKSAARTFTVDTTGPGVSVSSPAAGTVTRDPTPVYSGAAGNALGDASTVTVHVYSGSGVAGAPAETLTPSRTGATWSANGQTALDDGVYTVQAVQSDSAGNASASQPVTFRVDTTAPAPSIDSPAGGSTINDATPTYGGGAGASAGDAGTVSIQVYTGTSASGSLVQTLSATRSGSSWTVHGTTALADGVYTAQAEQSDSAGNVGKSAPITFTVDTVAAGVSISSPASGSATSDTTPTYSGGAGSDAGDADTVTVRIYGGPTASGAPLQSLTAPRSDTNWTVTGTAPLADGVYTARATQSDLAGNTNDSGPVTFTIDTAPPETAMVGVPSDPTSDPTAEFAFASADAVGFVCRLYRANQPPPEFAPCANPSVTPPLPDAAYVFEVAAVDAAGNRDGSPAQRTFRVDTVAPHTAISVGPGNTTGADAAFVFSADEDASFSCRLDGGEWQACSSPASYAGLGMGAHRFEVRGLDAAGNQETAGATHEWQVLKPGLKVPAVGTQALSLAREVVQLRRQLARTPLRRAATRRKLTLTGFDALTAGVVDLRLTVGPATFARARWDVPEPGRYNLPVTLTPRGRRLARARREILITLKLTFTDRAGRSLRAKTLGKMVRRPRAVRRR